RTPTMKINDPDRWVGDKDLDKFEEHLQLTFRWMQLNGLGGKRCRRQRVVSFGYFLGGKALTWFNDNVDGIRSDQHLDWSLIDVVMGLYVRFIHETAVQDATDDFASVKYRTSVDELYQDLTRHAGRMVYPPDKYTFRSRLMELLPSRIRDEVLRDGITAETSDTKTIMGAAKKAETMLRVKIRYDKRNLDNAIDRSTVINRRIPGFVRRTLDRPAPVRSSTPAPRPFYRPSDRFTPRPNAGTGNNAGATVNKTAANNNATFRRVDLSNTKCWRCGGIGHISTMPECPEYSKGDKDKTKIFALRPVVDDREVTFDQEQGPPGDEDPEDRNEREGVNLRAMSPVDAAPRDWQYDQEIEQYEDYHIDPRLNAIQVADDAGGDDRQRQVGSQQIYIPVEIRMVRPMKTCRESRCLVQMPTINGVGALTLFDTGCTTDSVSPAFATVAGIKTEALEKEIPLILGTAGSKSVINRGGYATFDFPGVENDLMYVDVINLDKYDATIGTTGMRRWGIVMDMVNDTIWIGGKPWKALNEGEEQRELARRNTTR
ncbi:hypothetical protein C8J56DRAFT_1130929, partial [Mycena floridula]